MPKKCSFDDYERLVFEKYGNRFTLNKETYKGKSSIVDVFCHEIDEFGEKHGWFKIRGVDLLLNKYGCSKCANVKNSNKENLLRKFKKLYPDKFQFYDFSQFEYKNNKTKSVVRCKCKDVFGDEHGVFKIRPNDLLSGYGCPKCGNSFKKTTEYFIKEYKLKFPNSEYDLSKVVYKSSHDKITVICPKHGEFQPIANNFLNGSGCPHCNSNNKSRMEEKISEMLVSENISFERQKTFECLKYKRNLFLDFYCEEYNFGVEVQGEQHFKSIERFGGDEDFELRKTRDEIKLRLCNDNGIKLFYITKKDNNIEEIVNYIETLEKK